MLTKFTNTKNLKIKDSIVKRHCFRLVVEHRFISICNNPTRIIYINILFLTFIYCLHGIYFYIRLAGGLSGRKVIFNNNLL